MHTTHVYVGPRAAFVAALVLAADVLVGVLAMLGLL
jgi:hypothetical protein